ncbi:histone acetyltransferase KAT6B-like isoform X2 [Saccoglossus kowalevskii]
MVRERESCITTEWILQAIKKIKKQKQRPSDDRICNVVSSSHGLSKNEILEELELNVQDGNVLRVYNKGVASYKDPAQRGGTTMRSRSVIITKTTELFRFIKTAIKDLREPKGLSLKSIEKYVREKCTVELASGVDLNAQLRLALKRSVQAGKLVKNGRHYKLSPPNRGGRASNGLEVASSSHSSSPMHESPSGDDSSDSGNIPRKDLQLSSSSGFHVQSKKGFKDKKLKKAGRKHVLEAAASVKKRYQSKLGKNSKLKIKAIEDDSAKSLSCPYPGCDGSGNVSDKFKSHKMLYACPRCPPEERPPRSNNRRSSLSNLQSPGRDRKQKQSSSPGRRGSVSKSEPVTISNSDGSSGDEREPIPSQETSLYTPKVKPKGLIDGLTKFFTPTNKRKTRVYPSHLADFRILKGTMKKKSKIKHISKENQKDRDRDSNNKSTDSSNASSLSSTSSILSHPPQMLKSGSGQLKGLFDGLSHLYNPPTETRKRGAPMYVPPRRGRRPSSATSAAFQQPAKLSSASLGLEPVCAAVKSQSSTQGEVVTKSVPSSLSSSAARGRVSAASCGRRPATPTLQLTDNKQSVRSSGIISTPIATSAGRGSAGRGRGHKPSGSPGSPPNKPRSSLPRGVTEHDVNMFKKAQEKALAVIMPQYTLGVSD